MYANTSKHNQLILYSIDLNDIKIEHAHLLCIKVFWTQINLKSRKNICTFIINHIFKTNIPNFSSSQIKINK